MDDNAGGLLEHAINWFDHRSQKTINARQGDDGKNAYMDKFVEQRSEAAQDAFAPRSPRTLETYVTPGPSQKELERFLRKLKNA